MMNRISIRTQHLTHLRASIKWELPHPNQDGSRLFAKLREELPQFRNFASWWPAAKGNEVFKRVAFSMYFGQRSVFDIDETVLCRADCGYATLEAAIHAGLIMRARIRPYMNEIRHFKFALAEEDLQAKAHGELRFYQAMAQVFAGLKYDEVLSFCREVWNVGAIGLYEGEPLKYWIDPSLAYLIALGQEGSFRSKDRTKFGVAFISASPEWATRPLAEFFDFDPTLRRLCSMETVVRGGKITDQIVRSVFGPSKVEESKKIWPGLNYHNAFGNSRSNDGLMLAMATESGVGVGPDLLSFDGMKMQQLVGQDNPLPVEQADKTLFYLKTTPPDITLRMPRLLDPPVFT